MNATDVLRGAADLLEERGHCKDALRDQQGSHCALGALIIASIYDQALVDIDPTDPMPWDARKDLDAYLEAHGALREHVREHGGIIGWNNHPDRRADEVINTMRVVANLMENGKDEAEEEGSEGRMAGVQGHVHRSC